MIAVKWYVTELVVITNGRTEWCRTKFMLKSVAQCSYLRESVPLDRSPI
jgi:hypothetical protein